ncbi:MAG: ABC-F family ATP-binding cassette domain-containing protein [Clostridiales Family XIII bacterium]|jgi:ATP-binding cassette subfamily F protein 3|nr:ABC-F family ATP-binding cassette domain-containing protein [Clostridiales Family XIII bacterium]
MIILSVKNLTKAYGTEVILKDVSFHLNRGERAGIVGANGAGKSTLMNILTGRAAADEGDVFIAPNICAGYLKQGGNFDPAGSVFGEMLKVFSGLVETEREMEALSQQIARESEAGKPVDALLHRYDRLTEEFKAKNGYGYRSEITGILSSMAFSESMHDKTIATLSGGERTRLALAALLLQKPDLLLLDEPTNHLDIGTLKWLEQYLKNYAGSIVVVSHDRYFLDQTVSRIFEIENHKLTAYGGNYSEFAEKKRQRREIEEEQYENQVQEIKRQEEIIRRFKQHGTEKLAKRARSREKQLARTEAPERPQHGPGRIKMRFRQKFKSGGDVLRAEGLAKGFGHGGTRRELFSGVDFDVKNGEHICMVGANGAGKSTLLKILNGELAPDAGWLQLGHNVLAGYYDQEQEMLDGEKTVLDEMTGAYRLYSDTEMRSALGRFLFSGDMAFQKVASLSGGERARLSLLKLMLSGANLLILDEPTNHLDINAKEIFEEALRDFPGTALIVSHDRYFLNRIPSRIMELTAGGLVNYLGGYDYYVEKKEAEASGKRHLAEPGKTGETASAGESRTGAGAESVREGSAGGKLPDSAEQRRLAKLQQTEQRRAAKELEQAEKEIAGLEAEIRALEEKMCDASVCTDHVLLHSCAGELQAAKDALARAYDKWMAHLG